MIEQDPPNHDFGVPSDFLTEKGLEIYQSLPPELQIIILGNPYLAVPILDSVSFQQGPKPDSVGDDPIYSE